MVSCVLQLPASAPACATLHTADTPVSLRHRSHHAAAVPEPLLAILPIHWRGIQDPHHEAPIHLCNFISEPALKKHTVQAHTPEISNFYAFTQALPLDGKALTSPQTHRKSVVMPHLPLGVPAYTPLLNAVSLISTSRAMQLLTG